MKTLDSCHFTGPGPQNRSSFLGIYRDHRITNTGRTIHSDMDGLKTGLAKALDSDTDYPKICLHNNNIIMMMNDVIIIIVHDKI